MVCVNVVEYGGGSFATFVDYGRRIILWPLYETVSSGNMVSSDGGFAGSGYHMILEVYHA